MANDVVPFEMAQIEKFENVPIELAQMPKRREIRNSTAEFLIFQIEGKEQGVEVYYKEKCNCRENLGSSTRSIDEIDDGFDHF